MRQRESDAVRPSLPVKAERTAWRVKALLLAVGVLSLAFAASLYWRDDILRTRLDPKIPYQTYRPPPAPDYALRDSWALLPADPERPAPGDPPADVFFVHSTTYDGGRDWNGPIDDAQSRRILERDVLPNYAEPYRRVGRLFAPRYRQASLYARLTLRDDALDARAFAYTDVRRAFDQWRGRWGGDRPLVIVGVEQGGRMAERLAAEALADPAFRGRVAVAHLVQTAVAADARGPGAPPPACAASDATGCAVAYAAAAEYDLAALNRIVGKAADWSRDGRLESLGRRRFLCVNPVTGSTHRPFAPESESRGAANATGLEPGVRPPLLPAQSAARCGDDGLLRFARPRSPALQRENESWAAHLRTPPFNLFWADLEADAARRVAELRSRPPSQPDVRSRS